MIGRRILIAQAILAGKTRYEINNHLSVSPNTFTQIRRWLESELAEYHSAHATGVKEHKVKTLDFKSSRSYLQRNYPGHYLLFSLVEELFKLKK